MTATLEEVKETLSTKWDEVSLIELLKVTSEQIVVAFEDLIEEDFDRISKELADDLPWDDEDDLASHTE